MIQTCPLIGAVQLCIVSICNGLHTRLSVLVGRCHGFIRPIVPNFLRTGKISQRLQYNGLTTGTVDGYSEITLNG
jgi:hypothetical protein